MLFGATEDDIYLSPAPIYHAAPLRFCMATHLLGATVVLMTHFDPERFLALVEEHRVTFTQVVPTMFVRMLKLPDEVRGRYDLSSLRVVVHAAAPCPVEVKERMIDWWGPVIHEYYAGTEGNGFVYCNSEQWLAHKGTVGTSLLGPVHVLDEVGDEVADRARPARSTSSRAPSSTTTTPRRRPGPATRRAGAGRRSATWATSTRTASCT